MGVPQLWITRYAELYVLFYLLGLIAPSVMISTKSMPVGYLPQLDVFRLSK